MAIEPFWEGNIAGARLVALTREDFQAVKATIEGLQALALRLWSRDAPLDHRTLSIDRWASNLPEIEAAALNGMLGQNYGKGPSWESDHPVSVALREE